MAPALLYWLAAFCSRRFGLNMLCAFRNPACLLPPAFVAGDPVSVSMLGGSVTAGQGAMHGKATAMPQHRAAATAGVLCCLSWGFCCRPCSWVRPLPLQPVACRCAKPASPNGMYSCRYCAAAGGPYVARWFNWLKEISEAEGLPANHTLKNPAFGGSTSGMGMPALAWCCAEALLCCCCLL